ncbi:MAG: glycosyltransferase, partial [candidate division Zixibacteria bacterium]|nr:glycosyltransferase [candidate division Zixibacteria bacterium]
VERFARYLRQANVNATSANYYDSWLNYRCDVNLRVSSMNEQERNEVIDQFAKRAIEDYDIFHFHFAHSLYPDFRDLKELRAKDKKILFSFWGSDARCPEWIMYQQARFLGHRPPRPYALSRQLYQAHKMIDLYADVLIGLESLPRGIWVPGFADTAQWDLKDKQTYLDKNLVTKESGKTYFVHAPSNQFKKGSAILLRLLKECRDDGMPIEIICINQMEPSKAREIYAYADYAIDQVGVGTYGLFGVEMMCWKIPVLVYQIELFDRLRGNAPVIRITRENFKSQIERCIQMKDNGEVEELGATSRKWAIEKEDINIAIPEFLRIYRDLLDGKQIPQNINRAWYEEEARMQSGFKSEFYKYMKEQDVFTEMGITVPKYDPQLYV